jgi:hypothetical protein
MEVLFWIDKRKLKANGELDITEKEDNLMNRLH